MKRAARRMLLIQLHHLGDVVLATPAIRAARAAFPDAHIDFLTGALGAQALAANPHLDSVLVAPRLRDLYRAHYDVVADLHSMPRSALYTAATRAPARIGIRGRGPRNRAYTQLVERERGPVYMARQKLRLLTSLGIDPAKADARLEIALDDGLRAWAHALFARHGLRDKVVAVSPVAKHPFKQWGTDRWAIVADALAEAGAQVLITSGPDEIDQARDVAERMRQPSVWQYGATSVRQLAAMYERCVLWVGNDGGPKHIAVAVGTPTVMVVRRQLGAVWSDESDAKQVAINSCADGLESVAPGDVVAAALRLFHTDFTD